MILHPLQKELDQLLEKRDQIRAAQMLRYDNGSATRRRTTTSNANADKLNDRIIWIREQIKLHGVSVTPLK